MKDFASDCGRILAFAVFSRNKKLAEKIIDKIEEQEQSFNEL